MPRKRPAGPSLPPFLRTVAAVGTLCASLNCGAEERWRSVAEVQSVAVRIHWVSTTELIAIAKEHGIRRPESKPLGFSLLRQVRETGAFVCDIYMPSRPARTDDRATASLGHELAHCLGFSHEAAAR